MKANKIAWNKILELKKTKKTLVLNDLFAKNPKEVTNTIAVLQI
jgi:hypothetical protein